MTEPSGKIVGRPMVVRACVHQQEFQHYAVDKYRAQRLVKFQRTRCAECAAKLAGRILGRTLSADGTTIEVAGVAGAGPQSVIVALARLWVSESGAGRE
jgi:hypothetical protein